MATNSSIEWTEITWNPVTGCDRVAAGCDNCYALALAKRLKAMGSRSTRMMATLVPAAPGSPSRSILGHSPSRTGGPEIVWYS
jgi:protein gp37